MSHRQQTSPLVSLALVLILLAGFLLPDVAIAAVPPVGSPPDPLTAEAVPNEVIVGFKPQTSDAARNATVAAQGSRTKSANDEFSMRVVQVPTDRPIAEVIAGLYWPVTPSARRSWHSCTWTARNLCRME